MNPDYIAIAGQHVAETSFTENAGQSNDIRAGSEEAVASFAQYLTSIIFMPHSLRMVCLTNLFCWMAHVCYSLYFTDFVGESVFHGDPKAAEGSIEYEQYTEGVRFGCWGMAMYSLSCACYSMIIEKLIKQYGLFIYLYHFDFRNYIRKYICFCLFVVNFLQSEEDIHWRSIVL